MSALSVSDILNIVFISLFVVSEVIGAIPPKKFPYGSVVQVILVSVLKMVSVVLPSLRPLAEFVTVESPVTAPALTTLPK